MEVVRRVIWHANVRRDRDEDEEMEEMLDGVLHVGKRDTWHVNVTKARRK